MTTATEVTAYTQAVSSGQYARASGLHGKYDNVRLHWEIRSLQVMLQKHLDAVMKRRLEAGGGLRVTDLGCGSGDGMETLLSINEPSPRLQDHDVHIARGRRLERYTGLEMNPALLEQAQERFGSHSAAQFVRADLREGLPFDAGVEPYDLYAASFGTLSHFGEDDTVRLLSDIARHAAPGALLVGDWLGRFAYEWTDLWDDDLSTEKWMDYRISYIYSPEERAIREIDSFGLRLLSDIEVRRVIDAVRRETGVQLVEKALFDRSLFVGRHIDTADYNPDAKPLRAAVNRLHEPGCRTDLEQLRFELSLPEGYVEQSRMLRAIAGDWNQLVIFTIEALAQKDAGKAMPEIPSAASDVLRPTMGRMLRAVEVASDLQMDDPRADWIEPQLACGLRGLEMALQTGLGCGHGLVAIYEIVK